MSGWVLFFILTSLTGLGYLAGTDAKRRRIFGQSVLNRRRFLWPARLAVFAPGLILLLIANWSGFMIWAGAITTLGWVLTAIRPDSYQQAQKTARSTASVLSQQGASLRTQSAIHWHSLREQLAQIIDPNPDGYVANKRFEELQEQMAELKAKLENQRETKVSQSPQKATPVTEQI